MLMINYRDNENPSVDYCATTGDQIYINITNDHCGVYTNVSRILVVVVQQRFAERLADVLEVLNREVRVGAGAEGRAAERGLHRVTVLHAHQPHDHPGRVLLGPLYVEVAVFKRELATENTDMKTREKVSTRRGVRAA